MKNSTRGLFLALALCLLLPLAGLGSEYAVLDYGDLDRDLIRYGESFVITWAFEDQASDLWLRGHIIEPNSRRTWIEVPIASGQRKGSTQYTPLLAGEMIAIMGHFDVCPNFVYAGITGGPDEGWFDVDLLLDRQKAQPGDSLVAVATPREGRAPYAPVKLEYFSLQADGREQLEQVAYGNSAVFTVKAGVLGRVRASVHDAAGRYAAREQTITLGEVPHFEARLDLSAKTIRYGQWVDARLQILGGQPPYQYKFIWFLIATDGLTMDGDTEDLESGSRFLPMEDGWGSVRCTVSDSQGRVIILQDEFVVTDQNGVMPFVMLSGQAQQPSSNASLPVKQPETQQAGGVPAYLNQQMATRSGPGTKYTEELGTLPQDTQIVLIEKVTTHGTPWGMVEFWRNGKLYRAYTGMKRIEAAYSAPEGSEEYYTVALSQAQTAYYGPGSQYATRKNAVGKGTKVRVLKEENGFFLVDYQPGKQWVRTWLAGL